MQELPSKLQWKRQVKSALADYWTKTLVNEGRTRSTLQQCCLEKLEIGKVHIVWNSVRPNFQDVRRAHIKARILTGTYTAQVPRDRARRNDYWKRMKIARQLRADNLAGHNQLQETVTVASPQSPVVSQPEKGCLDRTSAVSQSIRHSTIERETQPELNWIQIDHMQRLQLCIPVFCWKTKIRT